MDWRKSLAVAAGVAMLVTFMAATAFAEQPDWVKAALKARSTLQMEALDSAKASLYGDLDEDWSTPYIVGLTFQGLVKGEGRGRFNPHASISHAAAVTMAVRAVYAAQGLSGDDIDSKIKADAASIPDAALAFADAKRIAQHTEWVIPYLKIAVRDGLVATTDRFQPETASSRLYVAELLVRTAAEMDLVKTGKAQAAVDMQTYLAADTGQTSTFTDVANLSAQDQAYLHAAQRLAFINGYPDGSFKPNRSVSRDEMAKMVEALVTGKDVTAQAPGVIHGSVAAIDADKHMISVTSAGSTKQYTLAQGAWVFVNFKAATLADLQVGDQALAFLNTDGMIKVLFARYQKTELKGTVAGYEPATHALTVTADQSTTETVYLSGQTEIEAQGAEDTVIATAAQLAQWLVVGARVEADLHGDQVVKLEIKAPEAQTYTGTVKAVDAAANSFTLTVPGASSGAATTSTDYTVKVSSTTVFEDGLSLGTLTVGSSVRVKGTLQGSILTASEVKANK